MHFKLNIRRYSPISHFHKIVNIMRLSLVLCMLTIFCASATVSYSQVNEISLHLEDATLEQALEAIKQQSEYSFWYRNDEINLGRKVSVNINNQNIANSFIVCPAAEIARSAANIKSLITSASTLRYITVLSSAILSISAL